MKALMVLFVAFVIAITLSSSLFAQSPGDTIGATQCANATKGQRIAVDHNDGIHFTWMCGDPYPSIRNVKYNCFTPNSPSQWPKDGTTASYRNGAGYPQIGVMSDNRAIIAFHQAPTNAESLFCAVDQFQCLGAFDMRHPPNRLGTNARLVWPSVSVDHNNRVQMVATSINLTAQPVGYTRSNNGGTSWVALTAVDTVRTVSAMITSSPVSNKVAIVYCHSAAGDTNSTKNDVYYIQSQDGITWNWASDKTNITHYSPPSYLYASGDIDAVYDYNDNLHIVWIARQVIDSGDSDYVYIYHYDITSGSIYEITHLDAPRVGQWRFGSSKIALNNVTVGVDSVDGLLFAAYCRFSQYDCSVDSIPNGEIYLQESQIGSRTWSFPQNITNTPTPGCADGNCLSDLYPSMAKKVNDFVHIFYECNLESSDDIMLYLRIPSEPMSAGGQSILPSEFTLSQNYPNPFNAKTSISFTLPYRCSVNLSIYDILGRKQTILVDGVQEAGQNQVVWDASNFASGIYYARLQTNDDSQSIKMALLK
jgi:hypothetical protein